MLERRAGARRPRAEAPGARRADSADLGEAFAEFHKGTEGRKATHDDGVRADAVEAAARRADRQAGRADRARRSAHVRHGGAVPPGRHLRAQRPALRAGRHRDTLLYYKEAQDGQILEEGINEAGSMSSFIAAGTAYATHGINTIPFFIFYSMFGFQRVGDLIWAGADMRMRGFVLGGTAGRTTLNGEGLQHEDGHSHVLALPVPTCQSYDPAFAYELAVIIEDGIKRMYGDQENIFYYLTLMNEQYEHPPMPEGARDGILKGMYVVRPTSQAEGQAARAAVRQRHHPHRGAQGAEDPRGEVRRRRRRVERDQLRQSLSRRPRLRALEPAASRRQAARAVRDAGDGERAGRVRGGERLPEGAAGRDRSLAAAAAAHARHRRLRPLRHRAPRCATSSRSTPASSRWRRCTR